MTTIDSHRLNTITWVDLAASNPDAAVSFYCDVLGCTPGERNSETDYQLLMVGDASVAGVRRLSERMASGGMPPVWSTYISVADADATLAAIVANGGQEFIAPIGLPTGGRIAVAIDPAGAVFALFEGGIEMGFGLIDEPGAPCWFETLSRDPEAADAFYSAVFGWESTPMPGPMPYRTFSLDGGDPVAGMMELGPPVPDQVPSHWSLSFSVADADESVRRAVEAGATNVMPPIGTPYGRVAGLMDPWGAGFNVIDRSSAAEA